MKLSANIEATDEEIRALAADVARRGIVFLFQNLDEKFSNIFTPENTQSILAGFAAAIPGVQKMYEQQMRQRGPSPNDIRRPWPGVMFYPSQGQPPPGYTGPVGNVPRPNVVPFPGSDPVMKACLPIEETRNNEAAWACCQCGTPNSLARAECRTCAHKRCVVPVTGMGGLGAPQPVITPPPDGSGPNPPAA